jgi:hypothetical protein
VKKGVLGDPVKIVAATLLGKDNIVLLGDADNAAKVDHETPATSHPPPTAEFLLTLCARSKSQKAALGDLKRDVQPELRESGPRARKPTLLGRSIPIAAAAVRASGRPIC